MTARPIVHHLAVALENERSDLIERLVTLGRRRGRSPSALAAHALDRFLAEEEAKEHWKGYKAP